VLRCTYPSDGDQENLNALRSAQNYHNCYILETNRYSDNLHDDGSHWFQILAVKLNSFNGAYYNIPIAHLDAILGKFERKVIQSKHWIRILEKAFAYFTWVQAN
jgi:hypothetical protein